MVGLIVIITRDLIHNKTTGLRIKEVTNSREPMDSREAMDNKAITKNLIHQQGSRIIFPITNNLIRIRINKLK